MESVSSLILFVFVMFVRN